MIQSIKILHAWNQIKEYRFLADYFRMVGIYICGHTPQTDRLSYDFGVVIILKNGMDKNGEERRITMLIKMKELSSTAFDVEDADLLKVEIVKALAREEKRITEYLSDLD